MALDYVALMVLILVAIILFYGIIAIHDIPYEIAVRRNHPHQDALHVAGWVSLFTLHAIWPFLWIWATLYRPDRGWGFPDRSSGSYASADELAELTSRVEILQQQVAELHAARTPRVAMTAESDVAGRSVDVPPHGSDQADD